MKATFKIEIDERKLAQIERAAVKTLEQTAEALHTEVIQAQVMPRDTGTLQGESTFISAGGESVTHYEDGTEVVNAISRESNGTVTLSTTAPQARRLYFHPEYNFQTHENPNAKGKWLEDWLPGGKNEAFCAKAFKELFKRNAGL